MNIIRIGRYFENVFVILIPVILLYCVSVIVLLGYKLGCNIIVLY